MNFKLIFRTLGLLLIVEGIAMFLALIVALIYNGTDVIALCQSSLICMGTGGILFFIFRQYSVRF
ncbi:MAG TPA: hypothetical protein DCR40_13750 [Prolixibacteraceae bacterium]|nr:hypothetical protein [Prolixibacteraceae bacterium]